MRPSDPKEIELLKRSEAYGHHKLAGEEALAYYLRQGTGFPWVALRLADVIGQCGGSARLLPAPGHRLPLGSSQAG